ncbi:MAG TPA: glycosyltransferase [Opitutaceae bacterium]|nr:glycosyltransferase [Opitutaceae bacterium]
MPKLQHTPPYGGAFLRRFTRYSGLYFDEFAADSAWMRETAVVRLPQMDGVDSVVLRGELRAHPQARGLESGLPRLEILVDGRAVAVISARNPGPWDARVALGGAPGPGGPVLCLRLRGVWLTNALAWLGRVTGFGPIQRFRAQNRNRQLRISSIESGPGERIYDFSRRESPYSVAFARAHSRTGMNVVGFFAADLGIGESARCMVRAADAASIPASLVPLKLNCRNRLGDSTYASRLQDSNPHGVNVFHIDPPVARDIDHHHGEAFRKGKYNIGYFAWELPEFPDAWMPSLDYFDEIWCPSDFVRESVALKSPFPVLTMPHAISFERPREGVGSIRARLRLPPDPFLFLCLFDLNSYSARKNPRAAIDAFRRSGLAGDDAALVIKVQNGDANAAELAAISDAVRDLPGTVLIRETLSRADVYALEAACDCFVSLHRSEGFGLVVAESMYLGKPVIATGWSATSEYLGADNGFPVRFSLVELDRNYGPYSKGSTWAEPDIGHAAELMRRVASSPSDAARIGAAARRAVEERLSPAVVGARYRRRLEAIASL